MCSKLRRQRNQLNGDTMKEQSLEKLLEEAEADIANGRLEDFDQFIRRFKKKHGLLESSKPRLEQPSKSNQGFSKKRIPKQNLKAR